MSEDTLHNVMRWNVDILVGLQAFFVLKITILY